jgi:hypothetical protein
MSNFQRVLFIILLVLTVSGCATMVRGTQQYVPINSTPTGAQVRVNGLPKGTTPVTIPLSRRGDEYIVSLEQEGYKKWELALNRERHPWALLNILFGPFMIFGVIPDLINQANVTYTPEELNVKLEPLLVKKD